MTATPFTDFFDSHTTALMGRDVTKTYGDCAPGTTTFAMAWDVEGPSDRLRTLAERYVAINELRPAWGKEIFLANNEVCGDKTLAIGTKLGGFGHTYWLVSVLLDISSRVPGEISDRAYKLAVQELVGYWSQHNSYLALKNKSYGQTGRTRAAGLIVRALADACNSLRDDQAHDLAKHHLLAHIKNIADQPMHDAKQGDGLTIPHWRAYQLAILIHALEYAKLIVGVDTAPLVDRYRPIIESSVERDAAGVVGFWYDVPEPLDTPRPWPGAKLGVGNGVELWIYRYVPADAQAKILSVNKNLPHAVRAKFGMPT